jgi:hypothetical protein
VAAGVVPAGTTMGLKALEKFNQTMENWMERIANYFVCRSTNGRTEGFNRGLPPRSDATSTTSKSSKSSSSVNVRKSEASMSGSSMT